MDSNTYKTSDLIHSNVLEIGDGYRAKNSELAEEGLPFARAGTINNGFNFLDADRFPCDRLEDVGGKVSQPGDVVFTSKGTVGRTAFVRCTTPRFVYSPQLCYWRSLDQNAIWPRFLYYWMKSYEFSSQVNGVKGQSDMADYVSLTEQRRMYITLPSITVQREVASILGLFDDKIELLRQQNKTLEEIAQTIFKEWFVNFTVNGKKLKIDNSTGLPEGWRWGTLGDEFKIVMGQSPKGRSYNESGDGMVFFQGRAEFQERFPKTRLFTTEAKRIAERFDVLVSVRAPVGDINVASERCCIGRGLGAVRGKYKSYTLYKIKSLQGAFNIFESEGTVFGSIGKDAFANIETIIPDNKIITTFNPIAGKVDAKIFTNYSQTQTLSHLRDLLLPKLMKGEIRVKDAEKTTEEVT
ncbi:MAG: hypothetical protein CEE38_17435 [Planctomycetes bacterium B3_Pla]|nr:MAG: hypothetical protein CEE38_17435 [Planctomycetes bacterium B3_Pla]